MHLLHRVAARHFLAGFIPDKFWREQKAKLKAILTKPLKDKGPREVSWKITDELVPFFKTLTEELKNFGMPDYVADSLDFRFDSTRNILEKIASSNDTFERALNLLEPSQNVEDLIAGSIRTEIYTYYEENVSTLGDGLKNIWMTDIRLIKGLAGRIAKKASPEEIQAIIDSDHNWDNDTLRKKYTFFQRVKMPNLAKRLVSKEKIQYDFVKRVDQLREMLLANYTNKGLDEQDGFRIFDLHGMKIVIDDRTVSPGQIKWYVNFLDEAYTKLKSKGFAKVWYGTIFIRCSDCGGVNYNTGKMDVAGNYPIGPDVVNIFIRPKHSIVDIMAHELGHRLWFKFFHPEQRARFESLIRVHKTPLPSPGDEKEMEDAKRKREEEWGTDPRTVFPVTEYGKSDASEAFAEVFRIYIVEGDMNQDQLESFKSVLKTASERVVEKVLINSAPLRG